MKRYNKDKKLMSIIDNIVNEIIHNEGQPLMEMATCGVEKWGKETYKIAVHGASTKDRPTPHIHIYLNRDQNPYRLFNFEISFVELICNDSIVPIYQYDRAKNIKNTNRRECSWTGYKDIEDGIRNFLSQPSGNNRFGQFSTNIERLINEWNRETDFVGTNQGRNPMKEYLEEHGLVPHQKYQKYFLDDNDETN